VIEQLATMFTTLLIVIDPPGMVPIFSALTRGGDARYRRRMALRGFALATGILLFFVMIGDVLLAALGISLSAFRITGGILLFLLAIDMVFARQSGLRSTTVREQEEAQYREDISVFPLAFPLLAGPGALTTVLLLSGQTRGDPVLFAAMLVTLLVVLAITLGALLQAPLIMRALGETGANVVDRLLGLILAALAVQFVIDGLRQVMASS